MRGRLPTDTAHMRTTSGATSTRVMRFKIRLKSRWRRIAGRMRSRPQDRSSKARRGRGGLCVDIGSQVGWECAVAYVRIIVGSHRVVCSGIGTGGGRHMSLAGRRRIQRRYMVRMDSGFTSISIAVDGPSSDHLTGLLCKLFSCRHSSFFQGFCVRKLVSRQRGLPREGLQAIRVEALVRSHAGVDTTVPS